MAERLYCSDDSPSRVSKSDHNPLNINTILKSFITLPDSVSNSDSINSSFDHLLESIPTDSDQNDFIQRTLHVASVLLEAGKRSDRKRSSIHNALVWHLPSELTVKVFAMTDKQSLCHVAATCSFFHECAMDPLCFANIDFSTLYHQVQVNDYMASTMIKRAGNALRSLKLGDESGYLWNDDLSTEGNDSDILTTLCLRSLSWNDGAPGSRLRRLCLYSIERMENTPVLASLPACPSLVDLEIVGMDIDLGLTLDSLSKHCPLLECLTFDTSHTGVDGPKESIYQEFVLNCPNITTLALRGFKHEDYIARILMKGFHKLKSVDFSTSCGLTGSFLKNLGTNGDGKHLEVMILRDSQHLKKVEIKQFITAVLAGDLRLLRYLDISNKNGLASDDDDDKYTRCITTSFIPTKQLLEQRPNFCLLAEFPDRDRVMEQTTSDSSEYSEESSSDESNVSEETMSDSSEYSEESSSDESGSEESNFEANEENADEQRNI